MNFLIFGWRLNFKIEELKMLRKLSMFFVLCVTVLSFAQIKPSFQAFNADYLVLDEAMNGYHQFKIRVDYAPWAFVAEGKVKAPQGDVDLLFNSMDNDQLYIEVAYAEAPVGASDGLEYQAGIYDVMIFYSDGTDEFDTKIKDLKVSLLPPIAGDSWATGSLADAQGRRGAPGSVFKDPANADAIFKASARPLSKAQAQAARKAAVEKKKNAAKARRDSIAAAEAEAARAAEAAAAAKAVKKKQVRQTQPVVEAAEDTVPTKTVKRRIIRKKVKKVKAEPVEEPEEELSPRERKRQAMQAQQSAPKAATPASTSSDPCDQPGMTPLQKKRCRVNNK